MKNALNAGMQGFVLVFVGAWLASAAQGASHPVAGWLHWRGPDQNGTATETGLPETWTPDGENHLWSIALKGRGTAVIASYPDLNEDRVFAWGFRGEGKDVVEILACLDAATGETLWEKVFADFISDIIYDRYSTGAPTVDPATGHVYLMTSPGLLVAFDRDGRRLWERSMMEEFGRLTFPNGRTGAPSIDGDLVIINAITTNWGREGPARNRFYAFDKHSGRHVWSSTPGVGPPFLRDSSFCSPYFEQRGDLRVFYAGTGCGNIVCVNARTGDPLWRYQMSIGGVNSSVVVEGNVLVAIHGKENIDTTGRGRMVGLDLDRAFAAAAKTDAPAVIDAAGEAWRDDALTMFTSSPILANGRVYQVTAKGDLVCIDPATGHVHWHKKLGADQLHASPLFADGKLYVPMWHDGLYILRPRDEGVDVLAQAKPPGACIAAPSVHNGRLFLHTSERLYCFGKPQRSASQGPRATVVATAEAPARLQIVPREVLLRPGGSIDFEAVTIDRVGRKTLTPEAGRVPAKALQWSAFVPPTAKVKARMDATFNAAGQLRAPAGAAASAGAFRALLPRPDGITLTGTIRGRILPTPPYVYDFEAFALTARRRDGTPFAYPPLPWIGARLKWEIREHAGGQVLAKTLDRWLFQRSTVFIGHADDAGYTVSADVMSDGGRRGMSDVGVINQRYMIVLRGNGQVLEINSNIDRLYEKTPLAWNPKTWYSLRSRVDVHDDGSGMVLAKAWPRDVAEPEDWTLRVSVKHAHRNGSPGLFGFSPNIRHAVYIDNVEVAPAQSMAGDDGSVREATGYTVRHD